MVGSSYIGAYQLKYGVLANTKKINFNFLVIFIIHFEFT